MTRKDAHALYKHLQSRPDTLPRENIIDFLIITGVLKVEDPDTVPLPKYPPPREP